MSIPTRVGTVIRCCWVELLVPGLAVAVPSADQVLNDPVAEEEGKYTGKGEDPPENGFRHLGYLDLRNTTQGLKLP